MADGLQDVGAMVTAGLAAREVERGRGGDGHAGHAGCANCGTALTGAFCHACGQSGHVHRTAAAFFHDVAHGVFHFEGKVWHTLPMLAFRPGQLTRRYIDGERVRFVSPIALFLFSVFLMFASLGLWGHGPDLGGGRRSLTTIQSDLANRQGELKQKIAKLEKRRAEAVAEKDAEELADTGSRLADARKEAAGIATARRTLGGAVTGRSGDDEPGNFNLGVKSLDDKLRHATENPELTLYKLKTAAYKYSWALIPISLPFIWLMFPFSRRFGFYDHAIFATYSLSFMTLLIVAASVTMWAGVATGLVALALWLIPPVHIYRQIKGTYLLGRWGALIRTVVMLVFSLFTLILFGLLLGYLGLA